VNVRPVGPVNWQVSAAYLTGLFSRRKCGPVRQVAAAARTKIWGSGLINKADAASRNLDVLAVRGRLTANALGLAADTPLGDPALLIGEIFQERSKSFSAGLVPHYSDKTHPAVLNFAEARGVKVIDVNQPPMDVVRQISQCETIVSSSLHD
jgi:pyruvyltransferase